MVGKFALPESQIVAVAPLTPIVNILMTAKKANAQALAFIFYKNIPATNMSIKMTITKIKTNTTKAICKMPITSPEMNPYSPLYLVRSSDYIIFGVMPIYEKKAFGQTHERFLYFNLISQ